MLCVAWACLAVLSAAAGRRAGVSGLRAADRSPSPAPLSGGPPRTVGLCLHSIGRLGAGARPADNPRQLACAGSDATPWKRRQHAKVAKIEAQASSCHQAAQGLSVIKLGMEPSRPCPDLVPTITRLRRRRL